MNGRAPAILKRSVRIAGHRTSVSLEAAFWDALKELAARQGGSVQGIIAAVDSRRGGQNLSSAIRVFVLDRARAGELGCVSRPAAEMAGSVPAA